MFFFAPFVVAPMYYIIAIYFLAAVLPAIFLMRYVYRQDSIEQEPPYLLWISRWTPTTPTTSTFWLSWLSL